MGYRIAMTGLVMFIFFLMLTVASDEKPSLRKTYRLFGLLMLIGMFMIPAGLIICIWS